MPPRPPALWAAASRQLAQAAETAQADRANRRKMKPRGRRKQKSRQGLSRQEKPEKNRKEKPRGKRGKKGEAKGQPKNRQNGMRSGGGGVDRARQSKVGRQSRANQDPVSYLLGKRKGGRRKARQKPAAKRKPELGQARANGAKRPMERRRAPPFHATTAGANPCGRPSRATPGARVEHNKNNRSRTMKSNRQRQGKGKGKDKDKDKRKEERGKRKEERGKMSDRRKRNEREGKKETAGQKSVGSDRRRENRAKRAAARVEAQNSKLKRPDERGGGRGKDARRPHGKPAQAAGKPPGRAAAFGSSRIAPSQTGLKDQNGLGSSKNSTGRSN